MDIEFMVYVYARIERALNNERYREAQERLVDAQKCNLDNSCEELITEVEAVASELCYLQGYNDAMRLILNLK